jgi:IMP cyclohydrolase
MSPLDIEKLQLLAAANLHSRIATNSYPGRGVVLGENDEGTHAIGATWTMGRGPDSRNRLYKKDDNGRVWTVAADPSKVRPEQAKNILYTAMNERPWCYAFSNGYQTDDVLVPTTCVPGGLMTALSLQRFENDFPNSTSRITGRISCVLGSRPTFELVIQKRMEFSEACESHYSHYLEIPAGYGRCLTTYERDDNPLPSFQGNPYLIPLHGSIADVSDALWGVLDETNRVSLAVKFINLKTGDSEVVLRNKYEEVTA